MYLYVICIQIPAIKSTFIQNIRFDLDTLTALVKYDIEYDTKSTSRKLPDGGGDESQVASGCSGTRVGLGAFRTHKLQRFVSPASRQVRLHQRKSTK